LGKSEKGSIQYFDDQYYTSKYDALTANGQQLKHENNRDLKYINI